MPTKSKRQQPNVASRVTKPYPLLNPAGKEAISLAKLPAQEPTVELGEQGCESNGILGNLPAGLGLCI